MVTPAKVLYAGRAWASQVYHFGIGTRSAVNIRITFPDGTSVVRAAVAPSSRIAITPSPDLPPVASITAQPTSPNAGQTVSFDGTASSDPDGSVVKYAWDFGDATSAIGATVATRT